MIFKVALDPAKNFTMTLDRKMTSTLTLDPKLASALPADDLSVLDPPALPIDREKPADVLLAPGALPARRLGHGWTRRQQLQTLSNWRVQQRKQA